MGVPAFFRWLSRKYVSIIVDAVEERRKDVEGVKIAIDCTQPNPNYQEFDNLYLDMNGIIHPCTHPEHAPAPKTEEEMFILIFQYIDRLFSIVRPRKLLYMAIDGVAPRAKMNQQRSRRFRASKEAAEKREQIATIRKRLENEGIPLPPARKEEEHFDSNCITPGTPFMARLSDALRYYIHKRITYDPAWKKIQVILSDANAPGEGEHKIMDFIRRQRASPSHDPNTVHCLCGADADLIMLGLATHESNFNILREEFVPNQPKPCDLCAQYGHELEHCQGLARTPVGPDQADPLKKEKNFIFIRLPVLREYLERELTMPNLPFPFDLERAIDDWVMMCFFVGNDFLPHLPSLEIREGAIDRLVKLYKQMVYQTGGWLTEDGEMSIQRVQMIMTELGKAEDEIFKQRQMRELKFKESQKQKKRRAKETMAYNASFIETQPISSAKLPSFSGEEIRKMAAEDGQEMSNRAIEQAQKLKSLITPMPFNENNSSSSVPIGTKRKADNNGVHDECPNEEPPAKSFKDNIEVTHQEEDKSNAAADGEQKKPKPTIVVTTPSGRPMPLAKGAVAALVADEDESEEEPEDGIRLWEAGWKDRYYQAKFEVSESDRDFRKNVACAYVEGLAWVLRYYYQGCASWTWYYPYHYAPFASDFGLIDNFVPDFSKTTRPFKPLEQLMGVFPAASRSHIPTGWRSLMTESNSPIVDFYPEQFEIDLNGKKFAWQGVALLPFVDEKRLLEALTTVYDTLSPEEQARNMTGPDRLFVGKQHTLFELVHEVHLQGKNLIHEKIKEQKMQTNGSEESNLKEDENMKNEEETSGELKKEERNSLKNGAEHGNNENGSEIWEPQWIDIDASLAYGMSGEVCYDQTAAECDVQFVSMFRNSLEFGDIKSNNCIMVKFRDPQFPRNHRFKATRLDGINELPRVLKPNDYQERRQGGGGGQYRPQIGFTRDIPQATVSSSGHRMLNHHIFIDQPQSQQQQRRNGPPGMISYQQPPPPAAVAAVKSLPWHKEQNNQRNVPQNQQPPPSFNLQNGMFKAGQFASTTHPVQASTLMRMAMMVPPPAPPMHWTASNSRRNEQNAGGVGGGGFVGQWGQPPSFLQPQQNSNLRHGNSWHQNQPRMSQNQPRMSQNQPRMNFEGDRPASNRNFPGSSHQQQYPPLPNQPQQHLPYHRSNANNQQQNRSFFKSTGPREFRPSNRRSGQ